MFVKGKSGNPGGRPKVVGEVQELARQQGTKAIQTLVEIMNDKKQAQPVTRMAAACALLDRGYGKPMQSVLTMRAPLSEMADDELAQFIRHAREMAAGTQASGSRGEAKTRH